jgi:SAM-dependent methyltransferase
VKLFRERATADVTPFMSRIDNERLRDIQARYAGAREKFAKYADVEHWLTRHLLRIRQLGLDRSQPKAILDLGCGGGFFLFLAKQFGHSVHGLDIDEFPLFAELVDLLGVPRTAWRIEAFVPLPPLGQTFDWVTGFSTHFNRDRNHERGWTAAEWNSFLDDLNRFLAPGGQVFFEINSGKRRNYYPEEVRQLFHDRGAHVDHEFVHFPPGTL